MIAFDFKNQVKHWPFLIVFKLFFCTVKQDMAIHYFFTKLSPTGYKYKEVF